MANVVYDAAKQKIMSGDLSLDATETGISALLLMTTGAGYDAVGVADVTALLAIAGTAEPATGERVVVGARVLSTAGGVVSSAIPEITFAADAGQTAKAVVFYETANDALISVHDFTATSLDGGLNLNDVAATWTLTSV